MKTFYVLLQRSLIQKCSITYLTFVWLKEFEILFLILKFPTNSLPFVPYELLQRAASFESSSGNICDSFRQNYICTVFLRCVRVDVLSLMLGKRSPCHTRRICGARKSNVRNNFNRMDILPYLSCGCTCASAIL